MKLSGVYLKFVSCAYWLVLVGVLEIMMFIKSMMTGGGMVVEFDLGSFSLYSFSFHVVFDLASVIFMMTVCCIASCVCIYSVFYMSGEQDGIRFIGLLMLFVCSMGVLIFVPSVLGLMLGWDGLGVTSFLLVIYYSNSESLGAGFITVLSNRVGDVFFVLFLGLAVGLTSWGFWDASVGGVSVWVAGMMLVASMTKSAQVPFSAWLPAAMAAPTPVSTLVHSSTLVTAGIYVLFRFSDLFSGGVLNYLVVCTSIITFTLSSMAAVVEIDLKKVVALSTLSQLGVMLFGLSMQLPMVCFFHLITHAYFKSMMFLCVGVLIFVSGGTQDYRFMGGIWHKAPIVFSWLVLCFGCLSGLPFTSGFYSKDMIVESVLWGNSGEMKFLLTYISVGFTGLYSVRVLYDLSLNQSYFSVSGEVDWSKWCLGPISFLGVCALWNGYLLSNFLSSFSEYMFLNWKNICVVIESVIDGGLLAVYFWFLGKASKKIRGYWFVEWFAETMWFLGVVSGNFLGSKFLEKCLSSLFFVEKGWFSFFWSKGLLGVFKKGFDIHREGQLKSMAGIFLLAVIYLLFLLFLS